mmetsp:Transcript_1747/g.5046  ORF Transcript_1747/g.5046 Transcript_1747/m.5046 type:complete len:415 (+) Transcript_1747:232-1476(+)
MAKGAHQGVFEHAVATTVELDDGGPVSRVDGVGGLRAVRHDDSVRRGESIGLLLEAQAPEVVLKAHLPPRGTRVGGRLAGVQPHASRRCSVRVDQQPPPARPLRKAQVRGRRARGGLAEYRSRESLPQRAQHRRQPRLSRPEAACEGTVLGHQQTLMAKDNPGRWLGQHGHCQGTTSVRFCHRRVLTTLKHAKAAQHKAHDRRVIRAAMRLQRQRGGEELGVAYPKIALRGARHEIFAEKGHERQQAVEKLVTNVAAVPCQRERRAAHVHHSLRAAARQGRALPAVEQLYGVLLGAGHVVAEVVRRRVASPHHATPPTRGGGAPPALCTPRCRHSELVKFDFVEPCLITNGTPGPGVVADGIETRHAALRIRIARVEGDHRSQRVVVWFLFSTVIERYQTHITELVYAGTAVPV